MYRRIRGALPNLFTNDVMCAGYEYGGGSCNGDSGGPLLIYDQQRLHYKQIALVQGSVSISNCGDPYFHNIYVRIDESHVWKFIKDVVYNKTANRKCSYQLHNSRKCGYLLVIEYQNYSADFHNRAFLTLMLATLQLCVLRGARCALYTMLSTSE